MYDITYLYLMQHLISSGERVEMNYRGSSMLPVIPKNCHIVVSRAENLEVGKIYVYASDGPYAALVCHRLVHMENELLLFCGDNRSCYDDLVAISQVIGQCIGYVIGGIFTPLAEGVSYDTFQYRIN